MRAVVTGAAGFIGSHLCQRLLSLGWEVVGVDCFRDYYSPDIKRRNLKECLSHPSFFLVGEDLALSNFSFLQRGDYIFHLAAQPGVRKSWGREFSFYVQDNILATQRLLEASLQKGISLFLFASSSSVYGNSPDFPLREEARPLPFSPYGVTKLAAENLVRLYYENFSLPAVSLRFFTVFGPRQRPDMAFHRALKAILTGGEFTVYGDGNQVRDFTHVEDIVEGLIRALEGARVGEVYNLGSGREVTLSQALGAMERVTGRKIRLKFVEAAKGDVRKTLADITKARKDFGYEPRKTLEEGIEQEWNWIRSLYGD